MIKENIKIAEHGGDIYGLNSDVILDFSANINPLGLPQSVKKAIIENISDYEAYPDPECRELKAAISKHFSVSECQISCGNGAADIIYRLTLGLKPKKALIIVPTFSEYKKALSLIGTEIIFYYLKEENGFVLTEDVIDFISDDLDIIFICNPNNPTGIPVKKELMMKICDKCVHKSIKIVVDECFCDFLLEEESYSLIKKLDSYPNLIILKAFTKIYAMAGLRLGFALAGSSENTEIINNTLQPWSVSTIASKCGVAALKESDYVEKTKELIAIEREYLKQELMSMNFKIYDSQVNYLLFKPAIPDLANKLRGKSILIRSCVNYEGLTDKFYRIAVRGRKENESLCNALHKLD